MRKKKIDEAELPSDNLAVYQLVNKRFRIEAECTASDNPTLVQG